MSLNQIFMALAQGGNLIIVPESLRKDPAAVAKIVLDHNVTYTTATPSEYLAWSRHGGQSLSKSTAWKFATAGGEPVSSELRQTFRNLKRSFGHAFRVFNAYGPTEATLSASEVEIDLEGPDHCPISAGLPIPNRDIYIVSDDMTPLPTGSRGEICIAGPGVAIEYLNNREATRDKFVEASVAPGQNRMYRTGDLGALQLDGTLRIFGRVDGDTQIKLRGLRIELQDVERTILDAAEGNIVDVAVTAQGSPPILVAHAIMSTAASMPSQAGYLRHLAATLPLPPYMRPALIVLVNLFPLTTSGKVDRRALQAMPMTSATQLSSGGELTETENTLVSIWRQVLPDKVSNAQAIDETSDFFHVGGNSMLLIELREMLKKTLEVELTLLQLFEHSSLNAMAEAIQSLAPGPAASINRETETEVPAEFVHLPVGPPADRTQPRSVVLTGATGFLGDTLLRLLADDPSVDQIHCIAVRDVHKLADFASVDKVVVHSGDLSLPRCGLSEAESTYIFDSADAIIHNGADVSFLKSYSSLRAANLWSTRDLSRLAAARQIPFHYISTASVGKFNKTDTLRAESLAGYVPGASIADGYAASKWASEVFLQKVGKQHGLPVFIHRPSLITGTGASENDIVSNLLKYAAVVKAFPQSEHWTGYVDLISIERAGRSIADAVLHPTHIEAGTWYLHHAGERVIPAASIAQTLRAEGEEPWLSVPMEDWVDRAVASGMSPLVGEFLRSVGKGQAMRVGQKLL